MRLVWRFAIVACVSLFSLNQSAAESHLERRNHDNWLKVAASGGEVKDVLGMHAHRLLTKAYPTLSTSVTFNRGDESARNTVTVGDESPNRLRKIFTANPKTFARPPGQRDRVKRTHYFLGDENGRLFVGSSYPESGNWGGVRQMRSVGSFLAGNLDSARISWLSNLLHASTQNDPELRKSEDYRAIRRSLDRYRREYRRAKRSSKRVQRARVRRK